MTDLTPAQRDARKKKGPARLIHALALSLVALFLAGCLDDAADTTFSFGACANPNESTACTTGGAGSGVITISLVNSRAQEVVVISNFGTAAQIFTDWTLTAINFGDIFSFPDSFSLAAGGVVRIRTGSGTATTEDLYWEGIAHMHDTESDEVQLKNETGQITAICSTNDPCWNN